MKRLYIMGTALVGVLSLTTLAQAQSIGNDMAIGNDRDRNKTAIGNPIDEIGELRGLIYREDKFLIGEIDMIVTGVVSKTISARRPNSYFSTNADIKFDSEGQPMAHHQEYPRPTALSVALSFLDSIEFNPYPVGK